MADEELNLYDEIEIEDCFYDETLQIYHHPCPCGDRFEMSISDMRDGEDIARCPSCSLMIRIIFDPVCAQIYYGSKLPVLMCCSLIFLPRTTMRLSPLPLPLRRHTLLPSMIYNGFLLENLSIYGAAYKGRLGVLI
jgi:diphthamide biosynthesis protein 3